jgi:hypothetical protein
MTKRENISDPNSCFNKAGDDEEVFILLGRDVAAPFAIQAWCEERIASGKNRPDDAQILNAMQCAASMGRGYVAETEGVKS